jgi:hypothetical protein
VISNVTAAVEGVSLNVLVSWQTNEPATGRVEYGLSTSYGYSTPLDSDLTTAHLFTVTGMSQGANLHYRVRSADGYGNEAVSSDQTILVVFDTTDPTYTMSPPLFGPGTARLTFTVSELSFGSFSWGVASSDENTVALGSEENPALVHVADLSGLVAQTTYQTKLVLEDLSQNRTEVSSTFFYPGAITDTTPPGAPLGLRIAAYDREDGLTLRWNANSEPDLAGYNVQRRLVSATGDSLGPWTTINDELVTSVEYVDGTFNAISHWQYAISAEDESQNESARGSVVLYVPEMWAVIDLIAVNFPNPFHVGGGTQISFRTPESVPGATGKVKMYAYDVHGRRVKLLYSGNSTNGRTRTVRWDGTDQHGNALSPGVYFYRLEAGEKSLERKMVLVR